MNIHGLKKQRQKTSKLKTRLIHKSRGSYQIVKLESKIKRLNSEIRKKRLEKGKKRLEKRKK